MRLIRWTAAVAAAVALTACERTPTGPQDLEASLDEVDPVVITFAATQGLPGGPHVGGDLPPFMGAMPFTGGTGMGRESRGPGAPFPDSLRLTDAQKAQIQALVEAYLAANAADMATMKAARVAAREAIKAGKTREEVRAILEAAKPAAERVRAAAAALREAIRNVLTPAQRAWLDAHRPDKPPRTP
jgi:Spy/CpxP family protein refolding chaperone